ncbi:MAG: dihydropteroate synthase [Nitrospinales bacterium]
MSFSFKKFVDGPLIMGIVNLNNDSFYSDSQCHSTEEAYCKAQQMVDEGADILDIGAESSRPGSRGIPIEEEISQVHPVVKKLCKNINIPVSVDTTKSAVAEVVLDNGAMIINDITGLQSDPNMASTIAGKNGGVVVMHMKGTPETMQKNPIYDDLIDDITHYLEKSVSIAESAGISPDKIAVDPGIGFGKTIEHNLEILGRLNNFKSMDKPILIGASRKSFIGHIQNLKVEDRLEGSLIAGLMAVLNGAQILRVHDVKETRQMLDLVNAIKHYQ